MLLKADFKRVREIVFLKDVLSLSLSAVGGPEMHIPVFLKKLVEEKKYITETDLLELNSLCQILPGPSTTQTLTAIAYKMGGPRLAFISLLIWIMPAAILMTFFAISTNYVSPHYFRYIGPMALGFVLMAAIKMTGLMKKSGIAIFLAVVACLLSVVFHSPITFPVLLVFGAFMTVNFGKKDFIPNDKPLINIKWANLSLMILILISAALIGAITKKTFPQLSEPVRLFENTYRMGTMVFGGGNVLYSMILTEFVEFKQKQYLTLEEFNTGLGLLQAVPGPTFTMATFANGIAMKKMGYGIFGQLLGCGIGTIAIFLPGTLLIFFVYPLWNQIKLYPIVYRSLDGIIAVAIGLVWAAAVFMAMPYFKQFVFQSYTLGINLTETLIVLIFTIVYLRYIKLPTFILVSVTILAGILL
ncbi:MAG: chromate transporter [bacterium]|nr:chromate transporter [bacterium]